MKGWRLMSRIRQQLEWQRAELTPNDQRREERRNVYDAKYGMCPHGTHKVNECPGMDDS